jgi:hypothetical protein
MLDKGQDDDWFSSNFICWLAILAVIGFIVFIVWELKTPKPIVNLRVLKDRNLAIGVVLNLSVGAVLYATTAVIPQFLQLLLGYTSYEAGLVMSPRGIGAVIGSIVAGLMLSKVDGRLWMAQGAAVLGLSMFLLGGINLNISPANIIWPSEGAAGGNCHGSLTCSFGAPKRNSARLEHSLRRLKKLKGSLLLFNRHFDNIGNGVPMSKSVSPKVCISRVRKMITNNFHQSVAILSLHSLDDLSMIALHFL